MDEHCQGLKRPAVAVKLAQREGRSTKGAKLTEGEGRGGAGRLIFDIGANFGQSTERYLQAGFRVVSVEPNPVAAEAVRRRLAAHLASGALTVVERAIAEPAASGSKVPLYINEEDSEWSSTIEACGRRYDTSAREVQVEVSTMCDLFETFGEPWYIKIDVEGADGLCLKQLRDLPAPPYLSFELNSLAWLRVASDLGYTGFRVVAQSAHKAEVLTDEQGRPLTHAGAFGEDAQGLGGQGEWRSLAEALGDCRELCLVHDAEADVEGFVAGPPRFVDRDFATLQACFPIESRNDEEWYDVHCRHGSLDLPP